MRQRKLFMRVSAFALGIATLVETNANHKKFIGFSTAVTWDGAVKVIGSGLFTTVAAHGGRVFLATSSGMQGYLFTKVYRSRLAYLK